MPRKRRKAKVRISGFPDWQIRFMETGQEPPADPDINEFDIIEWKYHRASNDDPVQEAWLKVGERITADWIKKHAGTRPYGWYEFDAPRMPLGTWPGTFWDGKLADPRLRLGGTGTPDFEGLAFKPSFRFGIPDNWVLPVYVKWYPDKDLKAIDPSDPPTFESQASYLDRHKLLSDAERESLPGNAFEPVRYVPDEF